MFRKLVHAGAALVAATIVALLPAHAHAQNPVITSGNQTVVAGADYATDILGDPWDFSNVADVSPFPDELAGWTISGTRARTEGRSAFISGGNFTARTALGANNTIPLLYRGGFDFLGSALEKTGGSGHYAIPTATYGKLAVRMTLSADTALNSQLAAFWFSESYGAPNPRAQGVAFHIPKGGTRLYLVDMVTGAWTDDRGNPSTTTFLPVGGFQQIAWNGAGLQRGLLLRATSDGNASVDVSVDWVRLTQRDGQSGASTVPLTFTGCTTDYSVEVEAATNVWNVIHTGTASGTTTANVNYGILPPGTWNMRVTCYQINRAPTGGAAVSSTPVTLTINAPPTVSVVNPDATGGSSDFATEVLSNPWDMNQLSDVAFPSGVTNAAIVPDGPANAFQATGTSSGDPQATLLNGSGQLLSTRKYRNLTFTLTLDTPFELSGAVGGGSIARVLWGSQTNQASDTMSVTNDILIWPGRNTYTMDLAPLTVANHGLETECVAPSPDNCPQIPWGARSVRFFRIDPHEATIGVTFRLGPVLLTTPDEVALGNTYAIQYRFADADSSGSTYAAKIYLDTDRDIGTKQLIETITTGVTPGTTLNYTYDPNSKGTTAGEYFVYVEITETVGGATQTRGSYSTGPIRVFSTSATAPVVTVATPTANSTQPTPFTVRGCAFDQGNTSGLNMDDLAAFAIAGANVTGPQAGQTLALGFGNTLGNLSYAPLNPSTPPVVCESIANTASPFRNSGFEISNISGLSPGNWTLRVIARSTISGEFTQSTDVPFVVSNATLGPRNFTVTGQGNTINLSWQPPIGGPTVGGYAIQLAQNSNFNPVLAQVNVPASTTSAGPAQLGNGSWCLRVLTLAPGGAPGAASDSQCFTIPFGTTPPTPPGPPVLTGQTTANPITLSWSAGTGGAPTSYTLHAGSSPGASNLAVVPMGLGTSISANAPIGLRIYIRIVATNAAGSATSNEINFQLGGTTLPGVPGNLTHSVSASRTVTFNWSAATGATSYTIIARSSPTGGVIASLPGLTSTTFSVNAPPGTYFITVAANNSAGQSAESNQVQVIVP